MKVRCQDCVYFYPYEVIEDGECRKHSPRVTHTESDFNSCFPSTTEDWWCGEGRRKKGLVRQTKNPQNNFKNNREKT